jgi:hypothetical protein
MAAATSLNKRLIRLEQEKITRRYVRKTYEQLLKKNHRRMQNWLIKIV